MCLATTRLRLFHPKAPRPEEGALGVHRESIFVRAGQVLVVDTSLDEETTEREVTWHVLEVDDDLPASPYRAADGHVVTRNVYSFDRELSTAEGLQLPIWSPWFEFRTRHALEHGSRPP